MSGEQNKSFDFSRKGFEKAGERYVLSIIEYGEGKKFFGEQIRRYEEGKKIFSFFIFHASKKQREKE
ncbi:MAG: hypothetical protein J6T94_11655 [Bacteroidaceae bacterium]|nr:hypothetical protein [Bacteroidaceae bacterium]